VSEEGKAVPVKAVEAHRVVRRRGSHIFKTVCSQMAVRLLALRAGRHLIIINLIINKAKQIQDKII
jgi:hypothetical protein